MSNIIEQHKEQDDLKKERIAAAIIAALVQHGTIPRRHPKQNFVKKESEWKKRRINGLR
jgi:hypothetical protein